MAQVQSGLVALVLRISGVSARYGHSRTTVYNQAAAGLWPKPIKITTNKSAAWITAECDTVMAARIAGRSDDEIRALVKRLHAARQTADVAAA